MSDPKSYTIGWICAIITEYVAAQCFLDEKHDIPENLPNTKNDYTLGRIGKHNVVTSVLPLGSYGSASAAQVAENMLYNFPNVRVGLMVGIGGGVPFPNDVRLGDVVVSTPGNGRSGVVQYDFGKSVQGKGFQVTGFLAQPPTILRTAVSGLQAKYEMEGHQLKEEVEGVLRKWSRLRRKYKRPDMAGDRLYKSDVVHSGEADSICAKEETLSNCCIPRDERLEDEDDPVIHYGCIASGNQLMNDAHIRDRLAREKGVLSFEMEAAGLMNNFPCIVIRGICDYADSHQEEYVEWRGYAAMIAAAYAKDLLSRISPQHVEKEQRVIDVLKVSIDYIAEQTDHIVETTDHVAEITDRMDRSLALDKLPIANGAEYDSYADQYEVECLEGTRTDLLRQIREWASSSEGKCLFWLNGMAGTGKSTISRTVASVVSKSLGEQFTQLLLQPLLDLDLQGHKPREGNIVIVLDALDECDHDRDIRSIIRLLQQLQRARAIRIRVFLTSRPELPVRLGFKNIHNQDYQNVVLHDIPEEVTRHDISLFLHHRFSMIKKEREVPEKWPSERTIRDIINMSVPLFISAATVCRYIEHSALEPTARLRELLHDQTRHATKMEKTYMPILTRLVNHIESEEREQRQIFHHFQRIIGAIVLLAVPLSIPSLSRLLNIEIKLINHHLDSFQSVLSVPSLKDTEKPVRILHLSFRDFLVQASDSKFRVDEQKKHQEISKPCLRLMKIHLKKNICGLQGPATTRESVDPQCIRFSFPTELTYACRYWVNHFEGSGLSQKEADSLLEFLKVHFLHWVEAMGLLGLVFEVVGIIQRLQFTVSHGYFTELSALLHDASRFVLRIRHIVNEAPLQLYCSGLVFAPQMTIVRKQFANDIPFWITQLPKVDDEWSEELQTLNGHSGPVISIAFSPDGRTLASGSDDQTLRLWDVTTGQVLEAVKGSVSAVAVAFSPDGRMLAVAFSGFGKSEIRILDPITGEIEQSFDHPSRMKSIALSPDGQFLAVSTHDRKVRLWELETLQLRETFEGKWQVGSVDISPNGNFMAFSSSSSRREDKELEVQLWDFTDRTLRQVISLPSCINHVVQFSPNGCALAMSAEKAIHIWDVSLERMQWTFPSPDPINGVSSIAFSSDGQLLAASYRSYREGRIDIWEVKTGILRHRVIEQGRVAMSLKFSPGSRLLAAGNSDNTVRFWDITTEKANEPSNGHENYVTALSFSNDGKQLVSGSLDCNVGLWDPETGILKRKLEHSVERPMSISFAADDKRIAIGDGAKGLCTLHLITGEVQEFDCLPENAEFVESITFTPGGQIIGCIILSGNLSSITIIDLETGKMQEKGIEDLWSPIMLLPDCRTLGTAGALSEKLNLWDIETVTLKKSWDFPDPIEELRLSYDESYIYTNKGDVFHLDTPSAEAQPDSALGIITVVNEWLEWNGQRLMWLGNQSGLKVWVTRGNQ
ncbi:hypothetical protein PENSTE_c025G10455 [Penicillium steckii]|uniref:Nephrocystin 3-like N-terminal domain-containing protein n=1 Tax=Penicillium steckii TaxID=303698 RepID=A0A1V6SQC1_9EURO|nr:hypothetical protein PENSTE_c025G10455 [Penicillium steckii]